MKAFYTVPFIKSDEIIECGLKLADWAEPGVFVGEKKCIVTVLNPGDMSDIDSTSVLLKISVPEQYAYIVENALPKEMQESTIVPASRYRLGKYKDPRCLITCTVLSDSIEVYNKARDEIKMYQSSRQLYLDRLFNCADEEDGEFREIALKAYYEQLAEAGKYQKEIYENVLVYTGNDQDDMVIFDQKA